MTRILKTLAAAISALSVCTAAFAQDRSSCLAFDKKYPQKSTICRSGAIWVCEAGEWVLREGTRCTPQKK